MKSGQRGSASLEFVIVALAVLVPIAALTVSVSSIQRVQFAVTEISRQGVRAFALAPTNASGNRTVRRIARVVLADLGIRETARFTVTCVPSDCRSQGSLIRLATTVTVPLAMVPALPGLDLNPRVPVSASATHRAPLPVVP